MLSALMLASLACSETFPAVGDARTFQLSAVVDCSATSLQVDGNNQVGHRDGTQVYQCRWWQLKIRPNRAGCLEGIFGDRVTSEVLMVDVATACPRCCWSDRPNSLWAFCADDDAAVASLSQKIWTCQALGEAVEIGSLDALGSVADVEANEGDFPREAKQHGHSCCIDGHVLASEKSSDSRWANYDEGCSLGLRTGPEQHGNALTAAVPRKAGRPAAQITSFLGQWRKH